MGYMKEKLLYVTDFWPYPGGYGQRTVNQLKILSQKYKVYFIYFFEKKDQPKIKIPNSIEIIHIKLEETERITWSKLETFSILQKLISKFPIILSNLFSFSIPLFYSLYPLKEMKKKVEEESIKIKPDIVFARRIIGGYVCQDISIERKYIDLTDSLSRLYFSILNYSDNIFYKIFALFDINFNRNFERLMNKKYKKAFFITQEDCKFSEFDKFKCIVLPDLKKGEPVNFSDLRRTKKDIDLVMFGNWSYYPNHHALKYSIKNLFPYLSEYKIAIIGIAPKDIKEELKKFRNVKYFGFLSEEKMKEILLRSKLNLAPVFIGAGIQNKIIDGFRFGLPTITSQFTLSSFDEKKACIISAKDNKEIIQKIETIIKNKKHLNLTKVSLNFYKNYSKTSVKKNYKILLKL